MLRAVGTPSYNAILNAPNGSGRRVATIGTSLVQQSNATSSLQTSSVSRGWMPWAQFYSAGAIYHPVWYDATVIEGWEPSGVPDSTRGFQGLNFGVSGQTSTEIVARLPYIETNYRNKFDILFIDAGTNDGGTLTSAVIHANRVTIVEWALALGKIAVLLPILARATSSWASGSVSRKVANEVNSLSRTYILSKRDTILFDWNAAWIDGSTADGTPYTVNTVDGIHFDTYGGDDVGYLMWQLMSNFIPAGNPRVWSKDDVYDATYVPHGNILPNCFMSGTAGINGTGSSGSVADSMRSERSTGSACTVVCSKETRPQGRGEYQVLTFDVVGTTEELFYFRTSTADTTHTVAGQWVIASCEVETNASDALVGVSMYLVDQNGTSGKSTYGMKYFDNGTNNSKWKPKERSGVLISQPILLAGDSTTMRWRVEIRVRGAVTINPVIKIGGVELRPIADPTV